MSLPTGLAGAYQSLGHTPAGERMTEALTTLLWLRVLTDPAAPRIGGHDPRTILDPPFTWAELRKLDPFALGVLCARLNYVMHGGFTDDPLLYEDWHTVEPAAVGRALDELDRWALPAGDPVGVAYQLIQSEGKRSALGQFFTPYQVSLMIAQMQCPKPGETVLDPCCGSGGMLLAALEAVRATHGPDATLDLHGVDIDASCVRIARLNIALAGLAPFSTTARATHGRAVVHDDSTYEVLPPPGTQLELGV